MVKTVLKPAQLLEATSLLSTLTKAGLGVRDAVRMSETVCADKKLTPVLGTITSLLEKGLSLSMALHESCSTLPVIFTGLIRIGEQSGSLTRILPELELWLHEQKRLKDRLAGAMVYPALILVVAMAVVLSLVLFVLPRLVGMVKALGAENGSEIIRSAQLLQQCGVAALVILTLGVVATVVLRQLRAQGGLAADWIDARLLSLPLTGRLLTTLETLKLTFALEILSAGRMPLGNALGEAQAVVKNRAFTAALERVRGRVGEGVSLSVALRRESVFPASLVQWAAIGERTGQVEQVFGQVRRYCQGEIERYVDRFLALIEPGISLAIGIAILIFMVLFVLPLFSIYSNIVR